MGPPSPKAAIARSARHRTQARDAWRAARLAELLTVPYCHLVFTLPHEINALAGTHPRWVYDTLMQSAAQTLTEFAANPRWLGGAAAFTLVLHTWTQDLTLHLHVHALMACGALGVGPDGQACWLKPRRGERFLFPVHALSRVFRGKFMQALAHAERAAELPREPADSAQARQQRHQALRRHDWVVYAKTPLAGPAAVLDYLARYTHRTAIGNERLQGIQGEQVRFKVRANDKAGSGGPGGPHGKTSKVLDGVEFIAWPLHADCWPCRRPTPSPPRMRAPSCSGWPGWMCSAASTAARGAGSWWHVWHVWRVWRRSSASQAKLKWPAEARRDTQCCLRDLGSARRAFGHVRCCARARFRLLA